MSTMRVVDMAVIVMLRMLVSRHMVAADSCVRRGMGVMMISVIAMTVRVMSVMMLNCRRVRWEPAQAVARIYRWMTAARG